MTLPGNPVFVYTIRDLFTVAFIGIIGVVVLIYAIMVSVKYLYKVTKNIIFLISGAKCHHCEKSLVQRNGTRYRGYWYCNSKLGIERNRTTCLGIAKDKVRSEKYKQFINEVTSK